MLLAVRIQLEGRGEISLHIGWMELRLGTTASAIELNVVDVPQLFVFASDHLSHILSRRE